MPSISPFILRLCVALLAHAPMASAAVREPPSGIWFWADKGAPAIRWVSVKRQGNDVEFKLDGTTIAVQRSGRSISFRLDNQERFEGEILDADTIAGTWYQPRSDYFYSSMATQVELAVAEDGWTSTEVHLQPRPFHLFLDFFKDGPESTFAALRNPERNDILSATRFRVVPDTEQPARWFLEAGSGNRKVSIPIVVDDEFIEMSHFQVDGTVTFSRARDEDLDRYYSRPRSPTHALSDVPQLDDGWRVKGVAEAGFDATKLNSLVGYLASQDPRELRPQLIHSLLVSHRGHLVLEEYFYGHSREEVHDSRSMAKVFGTVLVGAANQQGLEISVEEPPLPPILEAHRQPVTEEDRQITLAHLLTYTTGLNTSEDDQSPGSEENMWDQAENFWLYTASLEKLHAPGSVYAYSSASAHMVGSVIEKRTKTSVREYFHETIAKPLGFSAYHWNLTPDGTSYLGGGVYLRPRDALKIGALYSQGGRWYGNQILPEQWVTDSTMPRVDITPETTGLSERQFSNFYFPGQQAYQWRVDKIASGGKSYSSYLATGNGGQMIIVVPELELAVGFTGGNYRMGSVWWRWSQTIIGDYLIPALLSGPAD